MKRIHIFLTVFVLLLHACFTSMYAQENVSVPSGYELVDSIVYRPAAAVDTSFVGKDIFLLMPSKAMGAKADVKIHQTQTVADAMRRQIQENPDRTLSGYRVRIFFDNRQTARTESEEALKKFEGLYHDVPAYRTYANPYFKVTVGDFRTRSEAVKLLERIRQEFPSAFVVKENISFPVVDRENSFVVDTVRVMRLKNI